MKTDLAIERHVASVFTMSIFNKLQYSIVKACFSCRLSNILVVGDEVIYEVGQFSVVYNKLDKSVTCSCNKFIRMCFICSHMFTVFKNNNPECIPGAYIVNRWRKDAFSLHVEDFSRDYGVAYVDYKTHAVSVLHSTYYSLVGKVEDELKEIEALTCYLQKFNKSDCLGGKDVVDQRKEHLIEGYYGSTVPTEVFVFPPDVVKTKGSGSRLVSRKEKAIQIMNKPHRKCSKCKQLARHDAKNCGKQ